MGTLEMRGNQIIQMSVSGSTIDEIRKVLAQNPPTGTADATFGSCFLSDNVIEHAPNRIVAQHMSLDVTDFTLSARPPGPPAVPPQTFPLGVVIADSAVFIGNHARRQAVPAQLIEVTRIADRSANIEIAILSA
jgi:hypothetical protein